MLGADCSRKMREGQDVNAMAESLWQEVEQRLRVFEGREGRHRACPYQTGEGEYLEIMGGNSACVDSIHLDSPFNSKRNYATSSCCLQALPAQSDACRPPSVAAVS